MPIATKSKDPGDIEHTHNGHDILIDSNNQLWVKVGPDLYEDLHHWVDCSGTDAERESCVHDHLMNDQILHRLL